MRDIVRLELDGVEPGWWMASFESVMEDGSDGRIASRVSSACACRHAKNKTTLFLSN